MMQPVVPHPGQGRDLAGISVPGMEQADYGPVRCRRLRHRGVRAAIRPASWFLRRHLAEDMTQRMHSSPSDPPLGRPMITSSPRAIHAVIFAVAMLILASPSSAQQTTAQQAPAASQPVAVPVQAAPTAQAPAPSAAISTPPPPAASDPGATSAGGSTTLKTTP